MSTYKHTYEIKLAPNEKAVGDSRETAILVDIASLSSRSIKRNWDGGRVQRCCKKSDTDAQTDDTHEREQNVRRVTPT